MTNKYLEKIAGFNGQSTAHLTKRIGQLEKALEKVLPNKGNTGRVRSSPEIRAVDNKIYKYRRELHDRWVMDRLAGK